jgi:hypothetical protein
MPEDTKEIETFNKFFVGAGSNGIVLLQPIPRMLSNDDALLLAAWLVAIADDGKKFDRVRAAVTDQ